MSNDYQTAVDGPITRRIAIPDKIGEDGLILKKGRVYVQTFPRWVLEDPAGWLDEIHAAMVEKLTSTIPKNISASERAKMVWEWEQDRPAPAVLYGPIIQPLGTRRVIRMSLDKAGIKTEAEQDEIINSIPIYDAQVLALGISGLFKQQREEEKASVAISKTEELEKKVSRLINLLVSPEDLPKVLLAAEGLEIGS